MKVRIGLIGAGWMGRHHGCNIARNDQAELSAVCDVSDDNIARLRQETGRDFVVFRDHKALLASDIDAVVIASPNALHAQMCQDAARCGKHIFCEKPMAITLDDCRLVRAAVEMAGVKYLIGYHRRFNPLYRYAKDLLDQGKLGSPFMVESDYLHHVPGDWDIWSWLGKEKVAGSLFHAGSGHNVDLLRHFCGEIEEASCMKGTFLPRPQQVETEDTAIAIFRFVGGAIGKVQFCIGPVTPFQFNFRLYGTRGTVIDNRVWLDTMPAPSQAQDTQNCITLPSDWLPDNVQGGLAEPWDKLMEHFIDMLVTDAPCLNDVTSAYRTSVACFAAMEAARRHQVVSVKEME